MTSTANGKRPPWLHVFGAKGALIATNAAHGATRLNLSKNTLHHKLKFGGGEARFIL